MAGKSLKEIVHDMGTYLDSGEPVDPQCRFRSFDEVEATRPKFTYTRQEDEEPPVDYGGR